MFQASKSLKKKQKILIRLVIIQARKTVSQKLLNSHFNALLEMLPNKNNNNSNF